MILNKNSVGITTLQDFKPTGKINVPNVNTFEPEPTIYDFDGYTLTFHSSTSLPEFLQNPFKVTREKNEIKKAILNFLKLIFELNCYPRTNEIPKSPIIQRITRKETNIIFTVLREANVLTEYEMVLLTKYGDLDLLKKGLNRLTLYDFLKMKAMK